MVPSLWGACLALEGDMDGGGNPIELGRVTTVTGAGATARLFRDAQHKDDDDLTLTIGRLVGVRADDALIVGVVVRMVVSFPDAHEPDAGDLVADIDFMGEIRHPGRADANFQRGVSSYPRIGDGVSRLGSGDISLIHRIDRGDTVEVGRLRLDSSIPAYVNFEELLRKHFAVLGTTGVGKSSAVALLLQEILAKKANLRVFLIDPHNEYGHCFGDLAHVINPRNLQLPFWLFNFEEIVDVFFRGRPGIEEESEILSELIPMAKAMYAQGSKAERVLLRKSERGGGYTADTPVPYRISDLINLIDERMGKLENRSVWTKYHRLITRVDTLGHDSRYTFMFNNVFIEDMMVSVLGDLFRLPLDQKPITVMQTAGFPSEVVDSVVSVVCRMAFEFGQWSDGAAPILVVCEEAHRYAPADRSLGFGPTRKAVSRIAKEGRKYGVFLGVVTQRPADLDATILSQCSTVFAMRMSNDNDQAIVRSAVPDAGSSLIAFLASLGVREAIAFGEGVPLPTRFRFKDLAADRLPRSTSGEQARLDTTRPLDADFLNSVVERWRDATTTTTRPSTRFMGAETDSMLTNSLPDGALGKSPLTRKIG
jgi:DNA helicase HerA-like ATPase